MKISPAILQQDFIGLNAKVVKSANSCHTNITGKVLNETRNTITILHKKKKKIIAKNTAVFLFTFLDETTVKIDGKAIVGRPEDRIKKQVKRRW